MILGHSSLLVSDYILTQAAKSDIRLTPFQIIKLVFIAHGRHLAVTNKPLLIDRIEAWKHGPVIPVLYHELKIYEDSPVSTLRYCNTPVNSNIRDKFFNSILSKDALNVINEVVKEYGDWTVSELYQLCHEDESPWATCYTGRYGVEIPDSVIQTYYKSEMVEPYQTQ